MLNFAYVKNADKESKTSITSRAQASETSSSTVPVVPGAEISFVARYLQALFSLVYCQRNVNDKLQQFVEIHLLEIITVSESFIKNVFEIPMHHLD